MPNLVRRLSLSTTGTQESSLSLQDYQYVNWTEAASRLLTTLATTLSGSATYTVYYSYEQAAVGSITRWVPLSDMTDATEGVDAQINRVVTAIKLDQTGGSGSVFLDITLEYQSCLN